MRTITMSSQDAYRGPLILVNREHPIAADARPQLAALPFGGSGVLMERRAAKLLSACVKKAGGTGVIVPVSGFRARDEQRRIWDDTMSSQGAEFTGKYVAMPGCSEHETGLAIDLAMAAEDIDFIRPDFPNTGACAAFRRLAAGYGFIERYRADKEHVTGIACEPWHFRYVGIPHARLMVERNLALEEYTPFLRRRPWRYVQEGGRQAMVFYAPSRGTETTITIPDCCYQVSGDNQGGFIVTLWEAENDKA